MRDPNNPVWDVYDLLRTARLNVKYYSCKLAEYERLNFTIEVIVAISTSSAIAGFGFWDNAQGRVAWSILGGISSVILVVKPFLGLPRKMKEYESILSGYRGLYYDLYEIKVMITQNKKYDNQPRSEFKKALKRNSTLAAKAPATKENLKLKSRCDNEVRQELPSAAFYVPQQDDQAEHEPEKEL